jgi:hypothetical protein
MTLGGQTAEEMTPRPQSPTGLLVIRIWIEADPGGGIRARILRTLDVEAKPTTDTYAGSVDEVRVAVDSWLDAFVAVASPPAGPAGSAGTSVPQQ